MKRQKRPNNKVINNRRIHKLKRSAELQTIGEGNKPKKCCFHFYIYLKTGKNLKANNKTTGNKTGEETFLPLGL